MTAKKGVYVLLYNHNNPCNGHHPDKTRTSDRYGAPSTDCIPMWQMFARLFRDNPKVMYGIGAEPTESDGTEEQIWQNYNTIVSAVRDVEDQVRPDLPYHLVVVQGTKNFGRNLDYYVQKPIAARQGKNVVYETHPYDPQANFDALVFKPAKTLPVIIGEFGVELSGPQKGADAKALMQQADAAKIPYLGWSFHQRCPGSLLKDNSAGKKGCGVGMKLEPSPLSEVKGSEAWGVVLYDHLKGTDNTPASCTNKLPLTNTCLQ